MSSPQAPLGNPPHNPYLFTTPAEKSQRVAANVIRQYDEIVRLVGQSKGSLNITPSILKDLQRVAIEGVYACAGNFRTWGVVISNTLHQPPPWPQVEGLVDEMCQYANSSTIATAIHAAAPKRGSTWPSVALVSQQRAVDHRSKRWPLFWTLTTLNHLSARSWLVRQSRSFSMPSMIRFRSANVQMIQTG